MILPTIHNSRLIAETLDISRFYKPYTKEIDMVCASPIMALLYKIPYYKLSA